MDKNKCSSCGEAKCSCEKKDFTKAVIEIDNPGCITLFRKVAIPASMGDDTTLPPAIGKYRNVLLVYEANNHAYLYSSDGIPTLLTSDVARDLENKIDAVSNDLQKEVSDREDADTELDNRLSVVEGIASTALQPSSIDKVVMTDINLGANTSTSIVEIDGTKENLLTGETSTKNIPLPVASHTQAGVMNSSTFDAVTDNSNNIRAIMNGAVAISGLPASPSQTDITDAWKAETGLDELINRASVYDVSNNKVWTYYSNDDTWHAASNTTQVTINTFTNSSEGTIKGSTNIGQVFAENDGTGSVNGWDTLSANVSTNTGNISSLQTAVAGKQNILTAGDNINISGNTISAVDTKYTAGNAVTIDEDNVISSWIYPERFFLDPGTKEGEGSVFEMSGTAHLKVSDIKLRGETSQNYYDGKNLLNGPYDMTMDGGLNIPHGQEANGNVTFGNSGTVQDALDGTSQKLYLYRRNSSNYAMPAIQPGRYVSITGDRSGGDVTPNFVVKAAGVEYRTDRANGFILDITNAITPEEIYLEYIDGQMGNPNFRAFPCLILESDFSRYEPFTGLEPSPSPLYPQRIKAATGEQSLRAAGANLYDYTDVATSSPGITTDSDGYITFDYDGNETNAYKNYWTNNLGLKTSTTYTVVAEVLSVSNASNFNRVALVSRAADSQSDTWVDLPVSKMTPGSVYTHQITTTANFDSAIYGLRTYCQIKTLGLTASITLRLSVLADTSITPDKFRYQPYIGQTTQVNIGKNIFDKNNATVMQGYYLDGANVVRYNSSNHTNMLLVLPCDPYTTYAISDQSSVGLALRRITSIEEYPQTGSQASTKFRNESVTGTLFTAPIRSKYLIIYYQVPSGVNINDRLQQILNTLQIERSQTVTPYASYFEPMELYKIGDAQDTISRDGLNWKLRKEVAKIIYKGNEAGWTFNSSNHSASIPHNGTIVAGDHLCTHFQAGDATSTNNTFSIGATEITFKSNEIITSLQDWKDWLAENPITVCAKLSTPVESQITQPEELEGLIGMRNIITYPDETSFSVGSQEDAAASLWVEAYLNSLDGITAAIRDIPICC